MRLKLSIAIFTNLADTAVEEQNAHMLVHQDVPVRYSWTPLR